MHETVPNFSLEISAFDWFDSDGEIPSMFWVINIFKKFRMAPPKNNDSDEDEYYKRPTLAERIGPEEARRMLMDDDEDDFTQKPRFRAVYDFAYMIYAISR